MGNLNQARCHMQNARILRHLKTSQLRIFWSRNAVHGMRLDIEQGHSRTYGRPLSEVSQRCAGNILPWEQCHPPSWRQTIYQYVLRLLKPDNRPAGPSFLSFRIQPRVVNLLEDTGTDAMLSSLHLLQRRFIVLVTILLTSALALPTPNVTYPRPYLLCRPHRETAWSFDLLTS